MPQSWCKSQLRVKDTPWSTRESAYWAHCPSVPPPAASTVVESTAQSSFGSLDPCRWSSWVLIGLTSADLDELAPDYDWIPRCWIDPNEAQIFGKLAPAKRFVPFERVEQGRSHTERSFAGTCIRCAWSCADDKSRQRSVRVEVMSRGDATVSPRAPTVKRSSACTLPEGVCAIGDEPWIDLTWDPGLRPRVVGLIPSEPQHLRTRALPGLQLIRWGTPLDTAH